MSKCRLFICLIEKGFFAVSEKCLDFCQVNSVCELTHVHVDISFLQKGVSVHVHVQCHVILGVTKSRVVYQKM
jgi:hypothetical protein